MLVAQNSLGPVCPVPLREARSDLQRDEEIFATRARELRDCKDALRRKDRENSDLGADLVRAEARADATEHR